MIHFRCEGWVGDHPLKQVVTMIDVFIGIELKDPKTHV